MAALPHILAFDTSAQITSLAVCAGERVLAEEHAASDGKHAELLLPRLQQALARAGIALADVDVIGVGIGPGSFTGVRVGVATAKGLGLALHKPVIGVVSLVALAHEAAQLSAAQWIAPCLDAYKGEVFAALYERQGAELVERLPPFHAAPLAARERLAATSGTGSLLLVGAGVQRYPELLSGASNEPLADVQSGASILLADVQSGASNEPLADVQSGASILLAPRASVIARLALAAYARAEVPELRSVAPLYLRDSDAQLPRTPLRV